jgi:SAM-dependent methyltransferase
MGIKEHWEEMYRQRGATGVGWYRPHLDRSLALIAACGLPSSAGIVDAGGGASTLVDDLLERGFSGITVIDLSGSSLALSQSRLGGRAAKIHWVQGDATMPLLAAGSVDLWHDRAVFHFLAGEDSRSAYVEQVSRCVRPGGFIVLGAFSHEAPEKCSGLPVKRYSPQELADALGPAFEKLEEAREEHATPWGVNQPYSYILGCRKTV